MSWNLYVLESLNTVEIQEWTNRRHKIGARKLNGKHMFLRASCSQTPMIYHRNTDPHDMLTDYVWKISVLLVPMEIPCVISKATTAAKT